MTTSNYMPDVKVEVAFNAGYKTPTASRTWTDISQYVELKQLIEIIYGRTDEFGIADANRLQSLTLDNSDGRFTAGKTGGAYYPNIKIGRPIRITATPVGGSASVRFLGYVEEWPNAWDGSTSTAWAKISGLSRSTRLGLDAPLRSVVGEEILDSNPYAYYPLNEAVGSVLAADAVGGSSLQVRAGTSNYPVAFGADMLLPGDPGTGLHASTSPTYDGSYLQGPIAAIAMSFPFSITLELFVTDSAGALSPTPNVLVGLGGTNAFMYLGYNAAGFTFSYNDFTTLATVTGGVTRSAAVHVCGELVMTSATAITLNLYEDGVLVATSSASGIAARTFVTCVLFNFNNTDGSEVAHITIGRSATGVAARAAAGLNGFSGESAGARVARLARYTDVLSNEVDPGSGSQPAIAIDTTGVTALETMRKIETVEGGVLHDSRTNVLTLNSRQSRFHTASAFTLTADQIETDFVPKLDRTTLVNDSTATAADGSSQRVINQASIDEYGFARETPDVAGTTEDAAAMATWNVLRFATPMSRIPALSIDFLTCSSALQAQLMAADIGTRFTISGLPAQAPAPSLDFFIEGYAETVGPESYKFTFNVTLVDSPTDQPFWILEDATYGAYDSRPLAY